MATVLLRLLGKLATLDDQGGMEALLAPATKELFASLGAPEKEPRGSPPPTPSGPKASPVKGVKGNADNSPAGPKGRKVNTAKPTKADEEKPLPIVVPLEPFHQPPQPTVKAGKMAADTACTPKSV